MPVVSSKDIELPLFEDKQKFKLWQYGFKVVLLNTDDSYIPDSIEKNSKVGTISLSGLSYLLGSLRNDDGHGNENVKRAIRLLRKSTTLHVHQAFLYIFSRHCTTHVKCLILRFMEDVNKRQRIFFLSHNLRAVPNQSSAGKFANIWHFQRIGVNVNSFWKLPFRCRRHCRC